MAALGMLAACSTAGPAPLRSPSQSLAVDQSVRIRLAEPVESLDPARARTSSELAVVRQLAEPLLKPGPDLQEPEAGTAISWDLSGDGLITTFHLRPNARFGDGEPVRGADFVYAWARIIDPRTGSPHADTFAAVVRGGEAATALDPQADPGRIETALAGLGLRAPDDHTFEVTAARPVPWLRWVATMPQGGPLRRATLERLGPGWAGRPEGLLGNGPFRVASLDGRDRAELQPNGDYWGGKPTLRRLIFEYVADDAVAQSRFQAGTLDVAVVEAQDPRRDVVRALQLSVLWLTFNTTSAPFDNARLRRAFAAAVDRPAIARGGLAGRGQALGSLVPQGLRGYHGEGGRGQEFAPAQAKTDLEAAGLTKEQLGGLSILTVDRPADRLFADAIAAQLRQNLGLAVALDAVDPRTAARRLRAGDFQLAAPQGWAADYPDQQQYFELFRGSDGHNLSRWRNSRYDLLVRQAGSEQDAARRDQLYAQAEQMLIQESPVAFLVQQQQWFLVRSTLKGIRPTPVDEFPGAVYASRLYLDGRLP